MLALLMLCLWFGQGQQSPAKSQTPANAQQQPAQGEPSAIPQQNAGKAGNEGQQSYNNAARWSDPVILLQLLLFFAVAVQAGIYVWQAVLMRRTLRVLDGQAKTFEKQAYTMQKQFELAALGLTQQTDAHNVEMANMEFQAKTMAEQLKVMREQGEHAKGQLAAMLAQEKAMRDSLDETRKTARYSEAAYIAIKDANLIQLEQGKRAQARLVFVNAGNTPAYNAKFYTHIELREAPLPDNVPNLIVIGGQPASQNIVAANGGERIQTVETTADLMADAIKRIQLGDSRFYVWGIATYEDIFGRKRWTRFCLVQPRNSMKLDSCGNNNEADEHENPN
jgi:hypothetical protein